MIRKDNTDMTETISKNGNEELPIENVVKFEELKFFYENESTEEARLGNIKTDLEEFVYQYSIDRTTEVYKDKNGNNVLKLFYFLPTFDAEDREWGSYEEFYIIQDNEKNFKGLRVSGGYSIAIICTYTNMKCADEKTKELLNETKVFSL